MFHTAIDITQASELDTAYATRILAQSGLLELDPLAQSDYLSLFGLKLINSTLDAVAKALVVRAGFGPKTVGQFINANCVNHLKKSAEYRDAIHDADVLLPDGTGIRIAGKAMRNSPCPQFERN